MSTSQSLLHTTRTCIGVHITRCRQESLVSLPPSLLNHTWLDDVCTYTHTCNTLTDTLTHTPATHSQIHSQILFLTPTNSHPQTNSLLHTHTNTPELILSRARSLSPFCARARAPTLAGSLCLFLLRSLSLALTSSLLPSFPLSPSSSLPSTLAESLHLSLYSSLFLSLPLSSSLFLYPSLYHT